MNGALQEADESQLWLELLRDDCGVASSDLDDILSETHELMAILVTIASRTRESTC